MRSLDRQRHSSPRASIRARPRHGGDESGEKSGMTLAEAAETMQVSKSSVQNPVLVEKKGDRGREAGIKEGRQQPTGLPRRSAPARRGPTRAAARKEKDPPEPPKAKAKVLPRRSRSRSSRNRSPRSSPSRARPTLKAPWAMVMPLGARLRRQTARAGRPDDWGPVEIGGKLLPEVAGGEDAQLPRRQHQARWPFVSVQVEPGKAAKFLPPASLGALVRLAPASCVGAHGTGWVGRKSKGRPFSAVMGWGVGRNLLALGPPGSPSWHSARNPTSDFSTPIRLAFAKGRIRLCGSYCSYR